MTAGRPLRAEAYITYSSWVVEAYDLNNFLPPRDRRLSFFVGKPPAKATHFDFTNSTRLMSGSEADLVSG